MPNVPEPRAVDLISPILLRIEWKDAQRSELAARALRLACPCAGCVEEWTGRRTLSDESVAADITLLSVELVGRYGLNFRWSDGHATGIFTWQRLRELGGA